MTAVTYSHARQHLAETMDRVCDDHAPIIVTRQRRGAVVLLSLEDFEAMTETTYLMRSPANAERLLEAVRQLDEGRGQVRELSDGPDLR